MFYSKKYLFIQFTFTCFELWFKKSCCFHFPTAIKLNKKHIRYRKALPFSVEFKFSVKCYCVRILCWLDYDEFSSDSKSKSCCPSLIKSLKSFQVNSWKWQLKKFILSNLQINLRQDIALRLNFKWNIKAALKNIINCLILILHKFDNKSVFQKRILWNII